MDIKSRIAAKVLTLERPTSFKIGKPKVKDLDIGLSLDSFVGPNSWLLFHVLSDDGDWLSMDPAKWEESVKYQETSFFVRSAKVVNDGSERGVKLIQDFCNVITTDSDMRRHLLKSVQKSREVYPDMKKSTLNK